MITIKENGDISIKFDSFEKEVKHDNYCGDLILDILNNIIINGEKPIFIKDEANKEKEYLIFFHIDCIRILESQEEIIRNEKYPYLSSLLNTKSNTTKFCENYLEELISDIKRDKDNWIKSCCEDYFEFNAYKMQRLFDDYLNTIKEINKLQIEKEN